MAEAAKACLFCAIVGGKIPAKKVFEDNDSVAFLDIHPRSTGMTIVMPKKHFSDMDGDFLGSLKVFQTAENVSQMIRQALGPRTVEMSIIPSDEVPHFHIRLYPIFSDERPLIENEPMKISDQELDEIAAKIKGEKVNVFASAASSSDEKEGGRSDEDAKYIRNQLEDA